jgi:hypothetical protein
MRKRAIDESAPLVQFARLAAIVFLPLHAGRDWLSSAAGFHAEGDAMRRTTRLIGLTAALLALGNAGCVMLAATAVGGGAVGLAYVNGKVTDTFDAPLDATAVATRSALQDLGLPQESEQFGKAHGEVNSRTGTERQIQIDLDAITPAVPADPTKTKVGVRVVAFGDEALSRRVLDQIQYRLRNPAPVSAAPPLPPPPGASLPKQTDEPPLAPPK